MRRGATCIAPPLLFWLHSTATPISPSNSVSVRRFRVASARCLFIGLNLAILPACSNHGGGQQEPDSNGEVTPVSIQEVQEAHTPAWMSIPGVVGTGIGQCDGEPCIKVFVAQRTTEVDRDPDSA
jgi:hypothetical protein